MARRLSITGPWTLQGFYSHPYQAAQPCLDMGPLACAEISSVLRALIDAGLAEPGLRRDAVRQREWMEHRFWLAETSLTLPPQPREGQCEKYFFCIPYALGEGEVYLNGFLAGAFSQGKGEMDITACLKEQEENRVQVLFFPGSHERAQVLAQAFAGQNAPRVVDTGLAEGCYIRAVSFARVQTLRADWKEDALSIQADIQADNRGRYVFQYRLMRGEELVASQNVEQTLLACFQSICHSVQIPKQVKKDGLFQLRLSLVRAGIRCDSEQTPVAATRGQKKTVCCARWYPLALLNGGMDEAAYRFALESLQKAGVQALELSWQERDVFYQICDERGLCVWHETRAPLVLPSHPCLAERKWEAPMELIDLHWPVGHIKDAVFLARKMGKMILASCAVDVCGSREAILSSSFCLTPAGAALEQALMPSALWLAPSSLAAKPGQEVTLHATVFAPEMEGESLYAEFTLYGPCGEALQCKTLQPRMQKAWMELEPVVMPMPAVSGVCAVCLRVRAGGKKELRQLRAICVGEKQDLPPGLVIRQEEDGFALCNDAPQTACQIHVIPAAGRSIALWPSLFTLLPWEKARFSAQSLDGKEVVANDIVFEEIPIVR